jgi:hypothetical protein
MQSRQKPTGSPKMANLAYKRATLSKQSFQDEMRETAGTDKWY